MNFQTDTENAASTNAVDAFRRLLDIKRRYDPDNLRLNQNIDPETSA